MHSFSFSFSFSFSVPCLSTLNGMHSVGIDHHFCIGHKVAAENARMQ
jgi:hypothetical protein